MHGMIVHGRSTWRGVSGLRSAKRKLGERLELRFSAWGSLAERWPARVARERGHVVFDAGRSGGLPASGTRSG